MKDWNYLSPEYLLDLNCETTWPWGTTAEEEEEEAPDFVPGLKQDINGKT